MKKILLFVLIFIMLFSSGVISEENSLREQNETYFYLLEKKGFDTKIISNRYISEKNMLAIMNILFNEVEISDGEKGGNARGEQLFELLEKKLKLDTGFIENKDRLNSQILTFPVFFDIMDYYFSEILSANSLTKEMGTLAENNGSRFLTYGQGKTKIYDLSAFPEMSEKMCEIELVTDNDKIVELIFPLAKVDTSMVYNKKEVSGKLFLMYDKSIVISLDGELKKYITTDSFEILRRTDGELAEKEIVLFTGVYKKNTNLITIAIERMN